MQAPSGSQAPSQPPFETHATAEGFFSDAEIERLIAEHAPLIEEAKLGAGAKAAHVRRSQVVFLGIEDKYRWLYERIGAAVAECNRRYFDVDIRGVEPNIQLARYDSSDRGFYDWHTDFAGYRPLRKLSVSVQLSRSEDYEGGDLELMLTGQPAAVSRAKGALIVFPSFTLHRVAPVTRGTRWSLVAWILGPRWR
jgi:predicted 2-oxoglutarate/Fe(II)-dependent dioxygenase YbiX